MKKYVRKETIENLKNLLISVFPDRKEFLEFVKEKGLNIKSTKDEIFLSYNYHIIQNIENGVYGEECKIDWSHMAHESIEGLNVKQIFLSSIMTGSPFIKGDIRKNYVNSETINSIQKDLEYIRNSYVKMNDFYYHLNLELSKIDNCIEIDYIKVLENLEELDSLKSLKYDLETIENFMKVIKTLTSDKVKMNTIIYVLKSGRYKDLESVYEMFYNDIVSE